MMVVVERAQAFMSRNLESKSLRDPLNGQVAKLLKFEFIHNYQLSIINCQLPFRYFSVFVYSPVSLEKMMNLRNTHCFN